MKQKIIINFIDTPKKSTITYYYKDCYFDIFKNFWLKIYCFFQWNSSFLNDLNKNYNEFWIYFDNFISINELIEKIKDFEIIEATTLTEGIIPILHEFKQKIWEKNENFKDIFRDKKLQRENLLNYDKDISINYKKFNSINDIDLELLKKEFSYPFIIKPVSWVQSQLVYKVKDDEGFLKAKKWFINADKTHLQYLNKSQKDIEVLIEEYVDWNMYSVDYYVDDRQNIFLSKIVKVFLWPDLWIDDFMNYNRISWSLVEDELIKFDLEWFIKKNIKATNIKNTFIHHEFKLNSKWQLKTIELNWRIWGFRLEMMLESYWFNMFRFLVWEKFQKSKNDNFCVFLIYSEKRWILKWFNDELINKVKNLKSYFNINLFSENIWKEIWLTKDWFPKSMLIKLKNSDNKEFLEDIKFLEKHYRDFLILD